MRDGVDIIDGRRCFKVHDVERLLGKLWWQSWVPVLCSSLTDALTTGHKSFFPHFSFCCYTLVTPTQPSLVMCAVSLLPLQCFTFDLHVICYEVCTYSYSPWNEALLLRIRYVYVRQQCSKQYQLVTSSHMRIESHLVRTDLVTSPSPSLSFVCLFFFSWHHIMYRLLVPWLEIEPTPTTVKAWSPNHLITGPAGTLCSHPASFVVCRERHQFPRHSLVAKSSLKQFLSRDSKSPEKRKSSQKETCT